MLTWKVGLVEAYDGLGAASAPNGDFLLPAILLDLILNTRQEGLRFEIPNDPAPPPTLKNRCSRDYLTHSLQLRMLVVEVLLKLGQLFQVPSFLA